MIGKSECAIQTSTKTQVECILGTNRAGSYPIILKVNPTGYANSDITITYTLKIASLSNSQCNICNAEV
jgi:hypothetical protein